LALPVDDSNSDTVAIRKYRTSTMRQLENEFLMNGGD
jgi:hypothetical protein